jgi:capsular exopolysaccharide synthesis family protein
MNTPPKDAIKPDGLTPDSFGPNESQESSELSLRQMIRVFRRRRKAIAWTVGIVMAIVVILSLVLPTTWSATSTIELQQANSDPITAELGEAASALTGESDLQTELNTETSILEDPRVGVEVLEKMHFADRALKHGLPFWHHDVKVALSQHKPLHDDAVGREYLLKYFENNLDIENISDTSLLTITYTDKDPKFSADVTNTLVRQYISDTLDRRNVMTADASDWMGTQLENLRKQVEVSQQNLVDFEKQSGFIVLPGTPVSSSTSSTTPSASSSTTEANLQSPLLNRLLSLNQTLVQAQANRIESEAIYRVAKTQDPDAIAALAPTMTSGASSGAAANLFSALLALRSQEITLKQQLASNAQEYGAKNPHVVDIKDQISYIDTEIQKEDVRILNTAASDLQMAKDAESHINDEVNEMIKQAGGINDSAVHLAILQQEADSTRELYEDLYTKLEEAKLAEETASSNISVISYALPGYKPHFPNWLINIPVGLVGGLFLGVIVAFVREALNDLIVSSAQVETLTRIPVIGIVPKMKSSVAAGKDDESTRHKLQAGGFDKMKGPATFELVESLRSLRTAILLSRPGEAPHSVVMASALPGEGKSTLTFNLSVAFASMGTRVLMVDGDMRKPTLHLLAGAQNKMGLSGILSSSEDVQNAIVEVSGIPNLSLLTAGAAPPNPSELLASNRFAEILAKLESSYDIVFLDSPPTLVTSDALIMSSRATGVIDVLRSGKSTRPSMLRVADAFQRAGANIIGFVLNCVDTKSSEFYYEYGYYGKSYYGEEGNEKTKS